MPWKVTIPQLLSLLRDHPKTARLALLLFSSLLSLAVAEMALRAIRSEGSTARHHQLFCEYHPVLGWQKKPSYSGIHVGPERVYRIRETMNSRGIRGPEYPYAKPPDEFRIVVLGDSFAEGYTVDADDQFSEVLKRRLNEAHTGSVQVINAGTGGYSTDQELLWFTTEGVKYEPDLVVLLFCSNDVLFNTTDRYWRGYKPLFRLDRGTLKLTNVPVPRPLPPAAGSAVSASASPAGSRPLGEAFARWLNDSSCLCRSVRDVWVKSERVARLLAWAGVALPRSAAASPPAATPPVPDYIRLSDWSKATDQERAAGWLMTSALLSRLRAEAESAGAGFLVMIVPDHVRDEVTRRAVWLCREGAIDCIDPTARFRAEELRLRPSGKKLAFLPLDIHWTADGHRLAAEVLREHIIEHEYLSRRGRHARAARPASAPGEVVDSEGDSARGRLSGVE